jgi:hypothetical protein
MRSDFINIVQLRHKMLCIIYETETHLTEEIVCVWAVSGDGEAIALAADTAHASLSSACIISSLSCSVCANKTLDAFVYNID